MINIILSIFHVIAICGLVALTIRLNYSLDQRYKNAVRIVSLGLLLLLANALAPFIKLSNISYNPASTNEILPAIGLLFILYGTWQFTTKLQLNHSVSSSTLIWVLSQISTEDYSSLVFRHSHAARFANC